MKMYLRLAIALVVSLMLMFALSYTQTRTWSHLLPNLSNFYISLTMIGSMGLVMLIVMWPMFSNKRANVALLAGFTVLLAGAFTMARTETFVDDEAFLKSMIPHHSRAVLVCQESQLSDPEVVALCDQIVESQLQEIAQMQDILDRMG
jgi:hypothetical protein